MDQVKTGKLLALLRHQAGMTQEELGETVGVTNKTISRWENGNYMPDVEMLGVLSALFHISVDELLAGERLLGEELRGKSDVKIAASAKESAFSFAEKKAYFQHKWRREHKMLFTVLALILLAAIILPLALDKSWLLGAVPLIAMIEYGFQNNKMMLYVESRLYNDD